MNIQQKKGVLQKCPKCNADLYRIIPQTTGETYEWNEDTGMYQVDDVQVSTVFKCDECGEIIGGWKSDGEEWGIIPEIE